MSELTLSPITTRDYTAQEIAIIKDTCCKGGSDLELQLLLYQARRTGLDPLSKQIYGMMRWDSQARREVMQIFIGINGYRAIAARTKRYRPSNEPPKFDYDADGQLFACTVKGWIYVQEEWFPISGTAYWDESVQTKNGQPTAVWAQRPLGMLRKCALSDMLQNAFPLELAGLQSDEDIGPLDEAGQPEPKKNARRVRNSPEPPDVEIVPIEPETEAAAEAQERELSAAQLAERRVQTARKLKAAWPRKGLVPSVKIVADALDISHTEAQVRFTAAGTLQMKEMPLEEIARILAHIETYPDAAKAAP